MTIQQLKFFDEVCRSNSIAEAAGRLFITPAGLRMALHRMEKELNCKLLNWDSKGVHPTKDGEYLLERIKEMLSSYEECEKYFNLQEETVQTITVASAINTPEEMTYQYIKDFNESQNRYKVIIRDYPNSICDDAVENEDADLGFSTGPFDKKKFVFTPVCSYPLSFVVRKDHPYAKLKSIPTKLLDELPLVTMEMKAKDTELYDACKTVGVKLNVVSELNREYSILKSVGTQQNLFGITNLPWSEGFSMWNVVLIPFEDPHMSREIYMFRKKGDFLSPGAMEFERYVKKELQEKNK